MKINYLKVKLRYVRLFTKVIEAESKVTKTKVAETQLIFLKVNPTVPERNVAESETDYNGEISCALHKVLRFPFSFCQTFRGQAEKKRCRRSQELLSMLCLAWIRSTDQELEVNIYHRHHRRLCL